MKTSFRSKSFLVSPLIDFNSFGITKKNSITTTSFPIKEIPDADSLQSVPSLETSTISKKPSVSGMEEVYNFNKSIKINNANIIQKLTLPSLDLGSPNLNSRESKTFESSQLGLSPLLLKNSKRKISMMSSSSISPTLKAKAKAVLFAEENFVDTLKRILSKNYNERNEDDIQILVRILSQISFFQTLGVQKEQNLIEKCCKYINLEYENKGSYVFHYGSQGTKFYIILKGNVAVMVPKFGGNMKTQELVEIKILKDGESFGELALISKKTRAASIICKEDCYFAVLEKKYFFEILLDFEERQLQSSIDFLRKYRIFNKWSPAQLNSVFLATNEKKFQRNHIVFQQGDTPNELFFIKSGEFEYRKEITYFDGEQFQEYPYIPDVLKDNYALRRSKKMEISVSRFGAGSLVGEESIFLNKPVEHTLICLTNEGIMITLHKMELFHRWNIDTFKMMMNQIKEECVKKEQKFQKRLEEYLNCFRSEPKVDANLKMKQMKIPKFKEDEFLEIKKKTLPELNLRKPKSISISLDNKFKNCQSNINHLKLNLDNETFISKLSKEKSLNVSKLTKPEDSEPKDSLKSTIKKINNCRNLKGLSKKRSSTLMMKVINEYENLIDIDINSARNQSNKNKSELNYSLTKRDKNDMVSPRINDPYCLITILNPKFRKEIDETLERIKLLRKKAP